MSESLEGRKREFRNIHVFDLMRYRFPLGAIVSILHRGSGAFLFLFLPFVLWLLEKSIVSELSFAHLQGIWENPFIRLLTLALVWAYLHHLIAGVRHLLMDFHIGVGKESGKKSAVATFAVSLTLVFFIGLKIFGVF